VPLIEVAIDPCGEELAVLLFDLFGPRLGMLFEPLGSLGFPFEEDVSRNGVVETISD